MFLGIFMKRSMEATQKNYAKGVWKTNKDGMGTCVYSHVVIFFVLYLHLVNMNLFLFLSYGVPLWITAGGVAEETFSAMRTVAALRAEIPQSTKFNNLVADSEKVSRALKIIINDVLVLELVN